MMSFVYPEVLTIPNFRREFLEQLGISRVQSKTTINPEKSRLKTAEISSGKNYQISRSVLPVSKL